MHCIADFCLIPIGTPTPSVSKYVAECQVVLRNSGLEYSLHSAGTTVEGEWDAVCAVIGECHKIVHSLGIMRVQSDIRIGTRTDKSQTPADKVSKVEQILAERDS
ncbi:YkoF-like protein [Dipodascopsis tothii]|uniref:YkoF-like protein n=1 Tax=Dipodascopsis tothii TaxID=44089 RepID=UPI0034CFEA66